MTHIILPRITIAKVIEKIGPEVYLYNLIFLKQNKKKKRKANQKVGKQKGKKLILRESTYFFENSSELIF